jgi:hypothetical protein
MISFSRRTRVGTLIATAVKYTPVGTNEQVQATAAKQVVLASSGLTPLSLMYSGIRRLASEFGSHRGIFQLVHLYPAFTFTFTFTFTFAL